jgi:hypothetical protein
MVSREEQEWEKEVKKIKPEKDFECTNVYVT